MQSRIGYGRKLTILQSDPALTDLDVYMPFLMVQELHFKREFSRLTKLYCIKLVIITAMKKILFPVVSALAIVLVVGQYALAATTATVGATVTVQNVSVSVSDGTIAYGTLGLNATASTRSPVDLQTATNNGNVTEQFNIKGMDATGSTQAWTLAATAGSAQYIHGFCVATCTTVPTNYTALTTSYATLAASVAESGTQTFDLYINTPTATTDYTVHTVDVTVQAVAI